MRDAAVDHIHAGDFRHDSGRGPVFGRHEPGEGADSVKNGGIFNRMLDLSGNRAGNAVIMNE